MNSKQSDEIDFMQYLSVIWKRKLFIISLTLICTALSAVYLWESPGKFCAVSKIMLQFDQASLKKLPLSSSSSDVSHIYREQVEAILSSDTMAANVADSLNQDKFIERLHLSKEKFKMDMMAILKSSVYFSDSPGKTTVIPIIVYLSDPQLAQTIANTYISELGKYVKSESLDYSIKILDEAHYANRVSNKKQSLTIVIIGFLFFSITLAFIVEWYFTRKKSGK